MGASEGIKNEFTDSISSSIRELFKFTGDNDEEKVAIADEGAKKIVAALQGTFREYEKRVSQVTVASIIDGSVGVLRDGVTDPSAAAKADMWAGVQEIATIEANVGQAKARIKDREAKAAPLLQKEVEALSVREQQMINSFVAATKFDQASVDQHGEKINRVLVERMGFSAGIKGENTAFPVPTDWSTQRTSELRASIHEFIQQNQRKYYLLAPYVLMIFEGYDSSTDKYYKPPGEHNGWDLGQEALSWDEAKTAQMQQLYKAQSKALWMSMQAQCGEAFMLDLATTKYRGLHRETAITAEKGNGPTAIYAVAAIYGEFHQESRTKIEDDFESAAEKMKKGRVLSKLKFLRKRQLEAAALGIQLRHHRTMAPMIETMVGRDEEFRDTSKQYREDLPDMNSASRMRLPRLGGLWCRRESYNHCGEKTSSGKTQESS